MKTRRIWLVVPILAVGALVLIQARKQSDGFEFLRVHNSRELVSEGSPLFANKLGLKRTFFFDEITPKLQKDIQAHSSPSGSSEFIVALKNGRVGIWNRSTKSLTFEGEPDPSWLDKQWSALKSRMGLRVSPYYVQHTEVGPVPLVFRGYHDK